MKTPENPRDEVNYSGVEYPDESILDSDYFFLVDLPVPRADIHILNMLCLVSIDLNKTKTL